MSRTPRQRERGQSGAAALVITIALVLVAAIGAGTLLASASALDVTAMATSAETVTQLSDRADVLDATGEAGETTLVTSFVIEIDDGESKASDGETRTITVEEIDLGGTNLTDSSTTVGGAVEIETDEINATAANVTAVDGDSVTATVRETSDRAVTTVRRLRLTRKGAPGADAVDASAATVAYIDDETHRTLTHGGTASHTEFATAVVGGDDPVLEEPGDRVRVTIDLAAVRGERVLEDDGGELAVTEEAIGLEAAADAGVTVVTAGGGETERDVSVPDVLDSRVVTV